MNPPTIQYVRRTKGTFWHIITATDSEKALCFVTPRAGEPWQETTVRQGRPRTVTFEYGWRVCEKCAREWAIRQAVLALKGEPH